VRVVGDEEMAAAHESYAGGWDDGCLDVDLGEQHRRERLWLQFFLDVDILVCLTKLAREAGLRGTLWSGAAAVS